MTQKCSRCGLVLPKTIEYFKKYATSNNKFELGLQYHSKCKQCELELLIKDNWIGNLLKCNICGEYFPEETFHKISKNNKIIINWQF